MTVDLRTNETTNMTWAVFDESKGGNCCEHYIATTIQGSILNIGGEYPVWSVDRGHEWDTWIPGVTPDLNAERSFPQILERKVSEKEASFKQQTATSSPCPGSLMLAVISNWTNSMPFSTMIPKWNGSGVTIESQSRSTTEVGRLKLLVQFRQASATENGRRSSFPISGIKRRMQEDKSPLMV